MTIHSIRIQGVEFRQHANRLLRSIQEHKLRGVLLFDSVFDNVNILYFSDFRHSDTMAVTRDGIEILTTYPGDWAGLVVPVKNKCGNFAVQ